jgi:hypothetical protein
MRNQQPATATFFQMMQTISRGNLCDLAECEASVIVYNIVKCPIALHRLDRSIAAHSKR